MKTKKILVYSCDPRMNDLIRDAFEEHYLKLISNYNRISETDHICLSACGNECDLMLITNCGIPIDLVKGIVFLLPDSSVRSFRPVVMSGFIDDNLVSLCRDKEVDIRNLPISISELLRLCD